MLKLSFLLVLIASWTPAIRAAEESCPWLDAPTAGGALDSPVEVLVTHPNAENKEDITCAFSKRQGVLFRALQIEVRTVSDSKSAIASQLSRCDSKPMELKAVGNEAQACRVAGNKGQLAEQVVGRLRDRIFLIQVRANTGWLSPELLAEKTCTLADQIVGNLF